MLLGSIWESASPLCLNYTFAYTVLEIQFRSVNYTLAAKIWKIFEQNKLFWR